MSKQCCQFWKVAIRDIRVKIFHIVRVTGTGSKNGRKNADFRNDLAMSDNACPIIQLSFIKALTFGCPLVLQVHRSVIAQKEIELIFPKKLYFLKFFNFTCA